MGLTPQQALLQLERYEYYEVYYGDKRYGFCSEETKIEFEEKHPNKFIFKPLNFKYNDFLFTTRLEKLINLLEFNQEKVDAELKTKNISDIL
jgi:YHS domain-containing protein